MERAAPAAMSASGLNEPHQTTVLSSAETGHAFGLATLTLPPHGDSLQGAGQDQSAKGCYVLRGTLAVTIGDRTITVRAGEAVYVEPSVGYTYWNPTASPVEALLIFTPPGAPAAPQ